MQKLETPSYDIIIVGGGPAGLFAAYKLITTNKKLKILILDSGKEVQKRICPMKKTGICIMCNPCDIMSGLGGSGTFSDGILNLRTDIVGGDLFPFTESESELEKIINEVDNIYLSFGAPRKILFGNENKIQLLCQKAASYGVRFIPIKQRHIGSEYTPGLIEKMINYLRKNNVTIETRAKVVDLIIEDGICKGVLVNNKQITGSKTLLSVGRIGAEFMSSMIKKYKIKARYAPIDVGVRVEVPAIIMEEVCAINRDPKFHIHTKVYDDFVRTFCVNHHGFVVKESYDSYIGVNGHSMRSVKSENSNFAFLVRVTLTEPIENTIDYGRSIAKLATTIGGGKPIVQRMGDLRRGRRSTMHRLEKNPLRRTLEDITPGDISMALPHRIVVDIIEGLEKLDNIIPGVASDSTLLYAPEIKFYSMRVEVSKNLETSISNLYAAGDGAGLSRDLVKASATGLLAGRGMASDI